MSEIRLADGRARPDDICYFVATSGRIIKPFVVERLEAGRWPDDLAYVVGKGAGLYDPAHCFTSSENAETFARSILDRELSEAERTVAELTGVEIGGKS
jgi:hypothetical protein